MTTEELDKACKWLGENLLTIGSFGILSIISVNNESREMFINRFREQMNEQAKQKVFIRGVKGRGKEVIAKLEALGGINKFNLDGECGIHIIEPDNNWIIVITTPEHVVPVMWAGTEIFLDEPIEEQKPSLKKNDSVMCSDDGKDWTCSLYYGGKKSYFLYKEEIKTLKWKYIVPYADFDFNDLKSNIKRSVV